MTLKEFFDSDEKLAIHCNTEEKSNQLLKEFDKLGKTWWTGKGYLENTCFNTYKDKTCYTNSGEYSRIGLYKDKNYKIYSFEDIIFEEDKPKNLIPEIAKMLGVEVGEEFSVVEQGYNKYKLDLEHGLMFFYDDWNMWCMTESTLNDLLINLSTIQKAPQLTDAERVILENFPKEYKYIARDRDYCLYLYKTKPTKNDYMYEARESYCNIHMFNHLFQFAQWKDGGPYNIKDLLKG